MDWAIDEAPRAWRTELYPHRLHRQPPRPALLRPLWLRSMSAPTTSWSATRPTRTSSCGRRCERASRSSARSASASCRTASSAGAAAFRPASCAGLNVGYGSNDDRAAIDENRRRAVAAVLPGAELATVHQVHSADVRRGRASPGRTTSGRSADAMVTDRPNLLLGILTADCAPVLFADRRSRRGRRRPCRLARRARRRDRSTIAAMEQLGARREHIHAAVGPCIAQPSYEVDDGFRARFLDDDPGNERFFVDGPAGKPHFDLEAYVVAPARSRRASARSKRSTSTLMPTRTASTAIRRATHRGEADYGRQAQPDRSALKLSLTLFRPRA